MSVFIDKPDPHLENYMIAKQLHPEAKFVWKTYQRGLVEDVDRLIELSRGNRELIESSEDWKVVDEIVKLFVQRFPDEANSFKADVVNIRKTRNNKGYSKSKEIMYTAAIPPRLMKMIRIIFPAQQWDKKFIPKLIRHFPSMKVGGS